MGTNTMFFLLKRAFLVVAALAIFAAAPVVAQETEIAPEHLALARKYVDLTDRASIYEITLVETAVETMRTILGTNPDIAEPLNTAIEKTLELYKGDKSQLMDQFARVYALNFTVDELTQIVAFYESPVGTKLATANSALNGSLQTVMRVFQVNLKTEFFAKVRAELKAAGVNV
jgi:hypothetical protein